MSANHIRRHMIICVTHMIFELGSYMRIICLADIWLFEKSYACSHIWVIICQHSYMSIRHMTTHIWGFTHTYGAHIWVGKYSYMSTYQNYHMSAYVYTHIWGSDIWWLIYQDLRTHMKLIYESQNTHIWVLKKTIICQHVSILIYEYQTYDDSYISNSASIWNSYMSHKILIYEYLHNPYMTTHICESYVNTHNIHMCNNI